MGRKCGKGGEKWLDFGFFLMVALCLLMDWTCNEREGSREKSRMAPRCFA